METILHKSGPCTSTEHGPLPSSMRSTLTEINYIVTHLNGQAFVTVAQMTTELRIIIEKYIHWWIELNLHEHFLIF